jgi:Golgi nucleoside diphosphatase
MRSISRIFAVMFTGSFSFSMSLSFTDNNNKNNNKHPLEDKKSWNHHVSRQLKLVAGSDTISEVDHDDSAAATPPAPTPDDDLTPYTIKHKKPKQHIPFAGGDTTHGMMIDAGSQGTRLHIYEWDKRFLLDEDDLLRVSHGKKLSFPTSTSRWTDKYTPGLDVFGYHTNPVKLEKAVGEYLGALLEFAKEVLKEKEDEWHKYPIYLKATGGVRTLPQSERVRIMKCVRDLFNNKTYNPFDFNDERARVISGEEEAIYGWVGVNFAKGVLIDQSEGNGVANNPQLTYGMLEMGGASTQIANFQNDGDMMANLFKLQLGGTRHWNVYVHSYLYTGINGAWSRINAHAHWKSNDLNPCLPIGKELEFTSWVHINEKNQFLPRSDPKSTQYTAMMVNNATEYDHEACSLATYALLRKETNEEWCDFQMDGNCGFAGIYQPPMPKVNKPEDEFVATSNFVEVYEFLDLGETATIRKIGDVTKAVCKLNWEELKEYNSNLASPIDEEAVLAQFCFRSMFVYQMLRNGWEFGDDYELTAVDVINGQKMGWALGCMLYEINTLPWDFHPELLYRGPSWWLISLYIVLGSIAGVIVGFVAAMRFNKKFNKKVRQSQFFKKSAFANNSMLRKSLAMPALKDSLDALNQLYDDDEKEANENDALLK